MARSAQLTEQRFRRTIRELGARDEVLAAIVDRVLAENPQAVADFNAGKRAAIGALIGKVKQASGGTANLKLAQELLDDRLNR